MLMILFLWSLILALPVAVVAFFLDNFTVLAILCGYTVLASLSASATLWRRF